METAKQTIYRNVMRYLLALVLALSASACTVRLIADYDAATDKAVTALQREVETFFVKLANTAGTTAADYSRHRDFYERIKVDIAAIEVRVAAKPRNELTLEQIKLLRDSLSKLEEIHKEGIRDSKLVEHLRGQFNTAFVAILKLELTKQRGE
ncbi:MAG: hypothetical protein KJ958_15090 [Gammaproteobacteria bacterium]|nr:hypothetical protein [Gammaproteobacteria bacterium]MBU1980484.1 hypothetical protein [Gammaproteobacteria bacterium]